MANLQKSIDNPKTKDVYQSVTYIDETSEFYNPNVPNGYVAYQDPHQNVLINNLSQITIYVVDKKESTPKKENKKEDNTNDDSKKDEENKTENEEELPEEIKPIDDGNDNENENLSEN